MRFVDKYFYFKEKLYIKLYNYDTFESRNMNWYDQLFSNSLEKKVDFSKIYDKIIVESTDLRLIELEIYDNNLYNIDENIRDSIVFEDVFSVVVNENE